MTPRERSTSHFVLMNNYSYPWNILDEAGNSFCIFMQVRPNCPFVDDCFLTSHCLIFVAFVVLKLDSNGYHETCVDMEFFQSMYIKN